MDAALHAAVAVGLVYALSPLGVWGAPLAVSLLFVAREMEQAAPKGERWRPWKWGLHKHIEWLVPAAAAFLTLVFL